MNTIPAVLMSIFPHIQLMYMEPPTKPVVSVTFSCPTELISIRTPVSITLHKGLDTTFSIINTSNMFPVELIQGCR